MSGSPRAKLRSPTHVEVYDLVVQGLSNEEISRTLNLAPRTVKYRISGILEATRQHNRVGLIAAHGRAINAPKKLKGLRGMLMGERQGEVYDLLVGGASGPTIARRLGITRRTVKFHMSSILERTGMLTHSRLVAAHWRTTDVPILAPTRIAEIVEAVGGPLRAYLEDAKKERDRITREIRALESAIAALEA